MSMLSSRDKLEIVPVQAADIPKLYELIAYRYRNVLSEINVRDRVLSNDDLAESE
uniref:Uncharacterized protein n=1 Tax=viral metagenome TaxID=1070528 RepID=A0A6M3KZJ6_9ZZZZ